MCIMVYGSLLAAACVAPFAVIAKKFVLTTCLRSKDQSYAIDAWSTGVGSTHCS